jgi:CheY-like chemotaxis protein
VHPKLLLADDSVTIQRVIELTFADEDVQVLAVGDGQQAIDRVKTDRPDIVLADVGMPERDGYEVAAFIKGDPELSHIPVLLLTGAFEPVDEARARAVGCDGVLVKPFEPQMVISRVRDLLAGKREGVFAGKAAHADAPPPPSSGGAPAEPASSLEDYFDRLDAALASKGASAVTLEPPPAAMPAAETAAKPGLTVVKPAPETRAPLADMDLTGWNPPAAEKPVESITHEKRSIPPVPMPAPTPPPTPSAVSPAPAASPATASAASPATPVNAVNPPAALSPLSGVSLDQAFAALLAAEQGQAPSLSPRRLESAPREWPDAVPDAVIDAVVSKVIARMGDESMRSAVLDAAERLVREEIDRIKNAR